MLPLYLSATVFPHVYVTNDSRNEYNQMSYDVTMIVISLLPAIACFQDDMYQQPNDLLRKIRPEYLRTDLCFAAGCRSPYLLHWKVRTEEIKPLRMHLPPYFLWTTIDPPPMAWSMPLS
jgi:hypothetical protein